jgi:hypothetical protein
VVKNKTNALWKGKTKHYFFGYDQDSEYRDFHVRSRGRPVKPALENLYKTAIEIFEAPPPPQKKKRIL